MPNPQIELDAMHNEATTTWEDCRRALSGMSFAALLYHALVGDGQSRWQMLDPRETSLAQV